MRIKVDKKKVVLSFGAMIALYSITPPPIASIIGQIVNLLSGFGLKRDEKHAAVNSLKRSTQKTLEALLESLFPLEKEYCDQIIDKCFSYDNIEEYVLHDEVGALAGNIKQSICDAVDSEIYDIEYITSIDYLPVADSLIDAIKQKIQQNETLSELMHNITQEYILLGIDTANQNIRLILRELSIPNSAYQMNAPPTVHNRRLYNFHFTSNLVSLYDRDNELERLHTFCNSPDDFAWWVITGDGGTGKSRLAYHFSKEMEFQNWTICYPSDHTKEMLNRCIENLPNDTLFILDYSEYSISSIRDWMSSFQVKKFQNIKIRAILIQRFPRGLDKNGFTVYKDKRQEDFLKSKFFNDGAFLQMHRLSDNSLRKMMKEYIEKQGKIISEETTAELLLELVKIDEKLKRPLFAIALADAYCDGKKISKKMELLEYICSKEEYEIRSTVRSALGREERILEDVSVSLFIIATMVGSIELCRELPVLMPEEFSLIEGLGFFKKEMFLNCGLFQSGNSTYYCNAIEPDIMGEFFALRALNNDITGRLVNIAWKKASSMNRFLTRLYQDFSVSPDKHISFGEVIIPEDVDLIEDGSFQNCDFLTSIKLPCIISIGHNAFEKCTRLVEVSQIENQQRSNLEEASLFIGDDAFSCCYSLTRIDLPSVHSIGKRSFSNCINLLKISIPEAVTDIPENAFYNCGKLITVSSSGAITKIGDSAFEGCRKLKYFNTSDEIKVIGNNAFKQCHQLIWSHTLCSVGIIGKGAFFECDGLLDLPATTIITEFGDGAFMGCQGLVSISFPDALTIVGNAAFRACTNLVDVDFGSVENIGIRAFSDCANLLEVSIPNTTKHIGDGAFSKCCSLKKILLPHIFANDLQRIGIDNSRTAVNFIAAK